MTGEVLLAQPPTFIQNILSTVRGSNKTSVLRHYMENLQKAKDRLKSQLGAAPTDCSTMDRIECNALRPSPTDVALTDSVCCFKSVAKVSVYFIV